MLRTLEPSTFIKSGQPTVFELRDDNPDGYPYWVEQKNKAKAIWFGKDTSNWKIGFISLLGSDESEIQGPHGKDEYPTMIGSGWKYKAEGIWHDAEPSEINFRG